MHMGALKIQNMMVTVSNVIVTFFVLRIDALFAVETLDISVV
jgi:hypothetical protein